MKTKSWSIFKNQGFTLLEVVITLIVGSILGAILVQFMGTSMKNSFQPVAMVQDGCGVYEIMEKMNADYKKKLMISTGNPLHEFKVDVEKGMLPFPNTPYFGAYTVGTKYIIFNVGNAEEDDSDPPPIPNVLKVRITHGGQSLTALFTK